MGAVISLFLTFNFSGADWNRGMAGDSTSTASFEFIELSEYLLRVWSWTEGVLVSALAHARPPCASHHLRMARGEPDAPAQHAERGPPPPARPHAPSACSVALVCAAGRPEAAAAGRSSLPPSPARDRPGEAAMVARATVVASTAPLPALGPVARLWTRWLIGW